MAIASSRGCQSAILLHASDLVPAKATQWVELTHSVLEEGSWVISKGGLTKVTEEVEVCQERMDLAVRD